jgi:hypothetical protein
VHFSFMKRLALVVKVPLKFVLNLSLSAGVFTAIWKESFVVPLLKSSDKHDVSCYRGISILSVIPKIIKKMVCNRITSVVCPVISDAQHDFVKGRSTVSNLVFFTSGVIGENGDRWQVDGVLPDFSKAFNRVLEVQFVNFIWWSLLCWMGSYITGRTHCVNSMSFRGSAGEQLGTNFLHFGY